MNPKLIGIILAIVFLLATGLWIPILGILFLAAIIFTFLVFWRNDWDPEESIREITEWLKYKKNQWL